MLKADLHLHAGEDKCRKLKYSSKELIDHASKKGFEVLSLTFHRDLFYNKDISNYAKKKGILLIPGVEKWIEGKEVLIYNLIEKEAKNLKTFKDLRNLKEKKDVLIIAPHPYFKTSKCLGDKLKENIDLFDAIEYSHFYLPYFNLNRKAVKLANHHQKTIIGNSDSHNLGNIGSTYSMIEAKKNMIDIFKAIKQGKVKVISKPVTLRYFIWKTIRMIFHLE